MMEPGSRPLGASVEESLSVGNLGYCGLALHAVKPAGEHGTGGDLYQHEKLPGGHQGTSVVERSVNPSRGAWCVVGEGAGYCAKGALGQLTKDAGVREI